MVYFIATIYFDDKKDKGNYLEYLKVNNPVPVSLLSGNRKPQICF